jgi:SAM-dependent methyltransferase
MPVMTEINEARRTSFDGRAALYDAARPSYPDALADDLLAIAGRRVLEIGAGTGKATVVFARRGASIVAIEPGPSLAEVLRHNVAGYDVSVANTTFEAWPIERRFDVVFAAQAIHWVDPHVRYTKPADVLAPGGVMAVIRNEKLPFAPDLRADFDAAYARWKPGCEDIPSDDPVEDSRREISAEIDASRRYSAVETRVYPWTTTLSTARYLDLLDTYSDHAILAADARAGLYEAIGRAIDRRGGSLTIDYVSAAFIARRL